MIEAETNTRWILSKARPQDSQQAMPPTRYRLVLTIQQENCWGREPMQINLDKKKHRMKAKPTRETTRRAIKTSRSGYNPIQRQK